MDQGEDHQRPWAGEVVASSLGCRPASGETEPLDSYGVRPFVHLTRS